MSTTVRPNVVFISMDATRQDHLSCYGYSRRTTPTLEGLAEKGVLYEKCFATACWTLPSHASMFTGLHVSQHGTTFDNPLLSDELRPIGQVMSDEGYQTVGFPNNAWLARDFGFDRGYDTYWLRNPFMERLSRMTKLGATAVKAYEKLWAVRNGRLSRSTVKWIDKWFRGQYRKDKPFFLFALLGDPHLPHYEHEQTRRFLGDRTAAAMKVNQDPHRYIVGEQKMSEEDLELLAGRYDGEIAYMDEKIGELLKVVDHYASMDNTMVIITSDHGENLGDYGMMAHQYCLYDTLIHVPLIIKYPTSAGHAGVRTDELVQSNELFTTILDVTGASRNGLAGDIRGRCLLPDQIAEHPLQFTISEELAPNIRRIARLFPNFDRTRFERQLRALRTRDHKYIWGSDGKNELYDLNEDPGELNNILKAQPELAEDLQGKLDGWVTAIESTRTGQETEFTALIEERLKGLGYL